MTVKIFYSYSHKDEELCARLISHLSVMRREGLIEEWHDRRLEPGQHWNREIRGELENADLILFLVSSDFLSSPYCYDVEVRRALERDARGEARVVPIILREVDWEGSVFANLTALPTDGKAVCSAHWRNQDQAFADVARNLRTLVQKIEGRSKPAGSPAASWVNPTTNLTQFHRRNPHLTGRTDQRRGGRRISLSCYHPLASFVTPSQSESPAGAESMSLRRSIPYCRFEAAAWLPCSALAASARRRRRWNLPSGVAVRS